MPMSPCLSQDTPEGTTVFVVNATDPDQGTGGSVLFSFQPPSAFFTIDEARGTVTVKRTLDYETMSAYQLTVNATDQDKRRPLSSLANLAITITDVQDMDPIFVNLPYSTNINEDSPPGYEVRKIKAIDQDRGKSRRIGYTIVSVQTGAATWGPGPRQLVNFTGTPRAPDEECGPGDEDTRPGAICSGTDRPFTARSPRIRLPFALTQSTDRPVGSGGAGVVRGDVSHYFGN
ncbi:hypothetical protein AAFF_G00137900 [Aldrovandia affinis]|uniref:Cadherin domain-containing protein n=1 Tax=Aldrovandia affinis TaxID=143900 RepID=A0AAD7TBU2_9TELE|nr:hypothetical protein AAFF_G00137900 [Aldrovandia affinis]